MNSASLALLLELAQRDAPEGMSLSGIQAEYQPGYSEPGSQGIGWRLRGVSVSWSPSGIKAEVEAMRSGNLQF